ncbi:MAG: hypothetical protein QX199_18890 [Methylococcaceae bacterium]
MIVILSGEGPTDLGQCNNAQSICSDEQFQVGPMAVLVDQMLQQLLNYSPRTIPGVFQYVSELALKDRESIRKNENRKVSLVGKKRDQETGYFYINAWMLGDIALERETTCKDKAIAILFRDCDGTRSTKAVLWAAKWKSMVDGFKRSKFTRGVPMLPKPKSEAWLLCTAKNQAYQGCDKLEDLPGNDDSPNSAKNKLDEAFGEHKSTVELCEWLENNPFDVDRASAMPSFKAFQDELGRALNEILAG